MPVASRQEQMYCSEQINIPVTFPNILKCYAKAAIRTQPYDLLSWTSAYFRALANGELPPVKERLEYPPYVHPSGITPRFLKILLNQYRHDEDCEKVAITTDKTSRTMSVKLESLLGRWRGMALKDTSMYQILMTGRLLELSGAPTFCDLYRFLAIACGLLGNNLFETMIYICELLTKEPDGGSAMISFRIFMNLYEYLADLDCSGGQSIIGTEGSNVETPHERDEASLVRSFHSSFSSSAISTSSFATGGVSSTAKETKAVLCRSIDNSSEDTETEESLCSFEVSCNIDEECASDDKVTSGVEIQARDNTRNYELSSARKPCGCCDTKSHERGIRARGKAETARRPKLESTPSENTTYEDKKHSELEVPEGTDERLGGGGTEVTWVQEERRRRRDVEMHSRTEKVRLTVNDETKAGAQLQPRLVSSLSPSAPSPRDGTSSSSPIKSHVAVVKDARAGETATREWTIRQEFDQTDKILVTRSVELAREAGGADVSSNSRDHTIANDPIESITRDGGVPTTVRNVNVERPNAMRIRKKKRDKSANTRTRDTRRDNVKIVRDSFEYDEPTSNDEDDFTSSKKRKSRKRNSAKISSKGNNTRDSEGVESYGGIALNPEDHVGREYDANESVEDEEFEDMEKYESIGLENILEGICECLETTNDTRDLEGASNLNRPEESSPVSRKLDPVAEFIERMTINECPTGSYILPEVPGIGPPVSHEIVTAVGLWLAECSRRQQGQVGPRNLRHFMCPDLDGKSRCEDYAKVKENTCTTRDESVVE